MNLNKQNIKKGNETEILKYHIYEILIKSSKLNYHGCAINQ